MIQLIPLAGPLLVSTDAWTYWEYGRIAAINDGDPYVDTPDEFPDDPAYEKAGADWRDTTSVYGPAFTLLSEVVALVSAESAAVAAWIFKALAALGVLACALLAARLARDSAYAAALVGWNPLFAIHFAGGGHNDSILIALTLGALTLAAGRRQGRRRLGAGGADQVGSARVLRPAGGGCAGEPPPRRPRRLRRCRGGGRRARDVAVRLRLAALLRPLARNVAEQSSFALRIGSSSSASRTTSRSCSRAPRWSPGSPGSPARRHGAESGSGSPAACCSRPLPG